MTEEQERVDEPPSDETSPDTEDAPSTASAEPPKAEEAPVKKDPIRWITRIVLLLALTVELNG